MTSLYEHCSSGEALYPSPAYDEPRRRELSGGSVKAQDTGGTRRLRVSASFRLWFCVRWAEARKFGTFVFVEGSLHGKRRSA